MKGDWLRAKALQIKETWETSEPTIPNGPTALHLPPKNVPTCPNDIRANSIKQVGAMQFLAVEPASCL